MAKPSKPKRLNPQQVKFCELYLVFSNATKAAEGAGYSKKSSQSLGYQLLQNPLVQEKIAELGEAASKASHMKATEVLTMLAAVARGNLKRILKWIPTYDDHGNEIGKTIALRDFDELSDEDGYSIESITLKEGGGMTVKLKDSVRALERLSDIYKITDDGGKDEAFGQLQAALKILHGKK